MLSLFKSRYYLKDIIPTNYIDIHNHILPGIDDGAKTIAHTKILIEGMKKINIHRAIPTPHTFFRYWNNTPDTIQMAYGFANEIDSHKSFLKGYASEYMLDMTLMERIKKERLLCIHETYILVELPLFNCPLNLYDMLFELKCHNYKIVIAHPERYTYFHNDFNKYKTLKIFDTYFQLNVLSLTGQYGKNSKNIAERLIENDMYDFTGTDIHNEQHLAQFTTKSLCFSQNKIGDLLEKNELFL